MEYSLASAIRIVHLVALALGVGAATAKNLLLLRCRKDHTFVPAYLKIEKPITAQIITGQALLTLSGIAYAFLLGYGFTLRLIVKISLVAALWVLGPVIDNVIGPAFKKSAPAAGQLPTPEFAQALNRYLFWDITATGIFYAIIVLWILMV
jgi:hypothetical protein